MSSQAGAVAPEETKPESEWLENLVASHTTKPQLPIISADQRLAEARGVKGVLIGLSGIGKTSQLWTLEPPTTLFFDLEAGDLAVDGWAGDTIRPRTWQECRDFAVFIGGPNPALRDDQPYSEAHYKDVCTRFGDPSVLDKYETVFIDSITVAGRLCFQWCTGQPQAVSDKTGKPDMRGAYGLMGQEMIGWLTHLQHTRRKNVWFVGILDEKLDDFNRRVFSLQIEGSKTGLELPGIVDEVITLAELKDDDGATYRAFVCQTLNPWGYPAKDRSGRLDLVEEPNLQKLMEKIQSPGQPAPDRLDFTSTTQHPSA
ncbi:MAG: ATP-binding protein [Leptospirillia bacterium]